MARLACSLSLAGLAVAVKQPHVLFIVMDDLGFDDVGFRSGSDYNVSGIRTPTIDALAADGIILNQYYVQDVCSPSRATFMTGRYAMHHTSEYNDRRHARSHSHAFSHSRVPVVDWIPPASAYGLPLNETTMAEKFQEAGYKTHASGKWHM
jgi:arylsulfatase B/arylsulfatase I/J